MLSLGPLGRMQFNVVSGLRQCASSVVSYSLIEYV